MLFFLVSQWDSREKIHLLSLSPPTREPERHPVGQRAARERARGSEPAVEPVDCLPPVSTCRPDGGDREEPQLNSHALLLSAFSEPKTAEEEEEEVRVHVSVSTCVNRRDCQCINERVIFLPCESKRKGMGRERMKARRRKPRPLQSRALFTLNDRHPRPVLDPAAATAPFDWSRKWSILWRSLVSPELR